MTYHRSKIIIWFKITLIIKKLPILLFSILISFNSYGLFGLFEKAVCVKTDAQERYGIIYLLNGTKPFTGKSLCEYENGQKSYEVNYKDGVCISGVCPN